MNAEFQTLKAKVDRMDQRISGLEQQMMHLIETTTLIVSNLCIGIDSVVESSRRQAVEFNRYSTLNDLPGVEVPFRDGTLPSLKGLRTLKSAADVDKLEANEALAFAIGYLGPNAL
ncbi:hypothetical protein V1517DRAFT_319117 [Lipomyces orientalis]|uniref:Uncharacterized protein n=1 Tax=Lipomyces orientalis TaxID=1233043 RepID=A0ACC3TRW4_9ASCO